jgi:PAS domain S-box-containing protein
MTTRFPPLGLRGRVILLLLAAFSVLTAAFVWHTLEHRTEMIDTAQRELLAGTRLLAARQQVIAARAEVLLTGVTRHTNYPDTGGPSPAAPAAKCSTAFAALLADQSAFVNLGWVRPDGTVVCAAAPAAEPVNFADRAWFRQALQTQGMVTSDVVVGRIVGQPLIAFARAVRDEAGQITGVAFLSLDLGWLHQHLIQDDGLAQNHTITVVDSTGTVVVRYPDPAGWTGKSAAHTPLFRQVAAAGAGVSEEIGLDGMLRLYAFTPLLETASGSMSLWFSVPKEVVLVPVRRELHLNLAITLTVLILTLGPVLWGGERLLLRPLLTISQQLTRYAAGDLTARSGLPHGNDEIGRLARILDDTADHIESSAQRFRAMAEASLDALFILDGIRGDDGKILDFTFTEVNARTETLLGMSREQIIGQRLCELLPFYRSGGFFAKCVAVAESGTPLEEEFPLDTPEIRAQWLRQQIVRVGDGVAISSRDVTVWKRITAEIHSQNRLRTLILESSGAGIFGLDLEGRATFVNPAACAMLRWDEAELIGQAIHPLLHHTQADGTPFPEDECPICRVFHDGEAHTGTDDLFRRKDGSSFPVEYTGTPMRDDEKRLVGAVVSFRDISERKQAEQTLNHALRALKTLSTGNGVLIHASDEGELLHAICRVIVEQGDYRMAWVGYADDTPEKGITPKAWAGVEEGYLAQLGLTWADDPERGQGPASRTIRSGELQITHDIRTDPACAPWHQLAAERGYAALLSLPLRLNDRVVGTLCIYAAECDAFDTREIELLTELGNDLAFGIQTLRTRAERDRITYAHAHHVEILQKSLEDSIHAIAYTLEKRDPYTAGHQRRVGELAVAIARELALPEEKIHGIHLAASVHDLGKVQVPAEILSKPGRLSKIEFMLIQAHPEAGYEILKDIEFPWPIADIVRQHHERLDGSGYPQGLKDGQILLEANIMAVADVVEAMASHRPYRAALGIDRALAEIERGRGRAYEPAAADACIKLFREQGFIWQT